MRLLAPSFRWAPAQNLHLTIRFCGGLDAETLAALRRELEAVEAAPFTLGLGGLGTFGGRRPRVVWLAVEAGAEPLQALAELVEDACRRAGLPAEQRPFRAHLTLARAADRERPELPDLPEPPSLEPWRAERFVLYESRLGRGPAVYVPIEEFALRG